MVNREQADLCCRGKDPPSVYTLDMLFYKSYVVTSAKLMQAVQRNSKIISFDPLLTAASSRIAGVHGPGLNLLKEKESGGHGLGYAMQHLYSTIQLT